MTAELVMTRAELEADPARWLEIRRTGITATDVPTILGLYPRHWDSASAFALWHRKKGNLPEPPDNDRYRLARYLQDYCRDRWDAAAAEPGERVRPEDGGFWRDGWRMASPDYLVRHAVDGAPEPLECRTTLTWDGWGHGLGCRRDDCEAPGTIPPYVLAQVRWQMNVLGAHRGHVAALRNDTGEFRWYEVDRRCPEDALPCFTPDEWAEISGFMLSLGDDAPPPVDDAQATADALKALHIPADPAATAEIPDELGRAWVRARGQAKQWEAVALEHANQIRAAMGTAKHATWRGERLCTRVISKLEGHWVAPFERDYLLPAKGLTGE